jgi:acyl-homoserine lactone acylase PvdQ
MTLRGCLPFLLALVAWGAPQRPAVATSSVAITRDDWGIAHVHGRTDADAVFGMIASGDVRSPHFGDQVERYASGQLRPVYFRARELEGHTERVVRLERR